jgi:hypothetical protein
MWFAVNVKGISLDMPREIYPSGRRSSLDVLW